MKHFLILALLSLSLAACARNPGPAASTASTASGNATTAAPTATSPPAAATAPVSTGDLNAQAKQEQEGGDSGTTDPGEASLEHVAALPAAGRLPPGSKWVPGTNYTVLLPAQPSDAPPGQVEVVEMFWYGCPHCYALEPDIDRWLESKPSYIDFVRVPVMWGDVHRSHARLFYTLQALGKLDQLNDKVFDEIHQSDELYVQGDPKATLASQLRFAQANGISAAAFTNAYDSFGVQTNLQKADALGRRYQVDAAPTIVIDGKYKTDVGMAGGDAQLIQLINDLAASEKRG